MAVKTAALRAGRPLPTGRFLILMSHGHSAAGRIRSIETYSDLIWILTRDLRACNIVPEPNTLARAPI
jgi:hypothetical protein